MLVIRSIRNWLNQPTGDGMFEKRGVWRWRVRWELLLVFWWVPYPLIGIYTFGYNATEHPTFQYRSSYVRENEPPPPFVVDSVPTAVKSGVGAILWPIYWTWEAMDKGELQCTSTN